ncbi:hypothetical protein TKK_0015534 [Trichogramma kaykai]
MHASDNETSARYDCCDGSLAALTISELHSRWFVPIRVGDTQVRAMLDAGATHTSMSRYGFEVAERCAARVIPAYNAVAKTFSGKPESILGRAEMIIEIGGVRHTMLVTIVESLECACLLGVDFYRIFNAIVYPREAILTIDGSDEKIALEVASPSATSVCATAAGLANLDEQQAAQLDELLDRAIPKADGPLGCTNLTKHRIIVDKDDESCEISSLSIEDEKDAWYRKLFTDVKREPQKFPWHKVVGNRLYHYRPDASIEDLIEDQDAWKLLVPKHKRREILRENHEEPTAGHFGRHKTYERIALRYHWPSLHRDVTRYVKACQICSGGIASKMVPPFTGPYVVSQVLGSNVYEISDEQGNVVCESPTNDLRPIDFEEDPSDDELASSAGEENPPPIEENNQAAKSKKPPRTRQQRIVVNRIAAVRRPKRSLVTQNSSGKPVPRKVRGPDAVKHDAVTAGADSNITTEKDIGLVPRMTRTRAAKLAQSV